MNGCKPGKITGARTAEETPGGLTCGINSGTKPGMQEPRQTRHTSSEAKTCFKPLVLAPVAYKSVPTVNNTSA